MPDFNKEKEPLFVFFGHLGIPRTKSVLSRKEVSTFR